MDKILLHQSVIINGVSSEAKDLDSGIPQGSIFGPFSFPSYQSRPIAAICKKYGIEFHIYADDLQTYDLESYKVKSLLKSWKCV